MSAVARDARPPLALVRMLNPIMRATLRTRLGRVVKPFALLEFSGRRTGQRYLVSVGWYFDGTTPVVFTPAPWRANFASGANVTVHHRGRAQQMTGMLVTDRDQVAAALQSVFDGGIAPRRVGIDIPADHRMNESDVAALGRALIRFHRADAAPAGPTRI